MTYLPKDYYVYIHRRASDGAAFYVGKGKDRRAFKNSKRSSLWKSIVQKHGLIIEIYQDSLQEWYALELEKELILSYGRIDLGTGILCNFTDGGDTTNLSPLARAKISESRRGTKWSESTRCIHSKVRFNNFRSDSVLSLKHKSGDTFVGTKKEFIEQYSRALIPAISHVIAGRTKCSAGWYLSSTNLSRPVKYKKPKTPKVPVSDRKFKFKHANGALIECTRLELSIKLGVAKSTIADIFRTKNSRPVRGWSLLKEEDGTK